MFDENSIMASRFKRSVRLCFRPLVSIISSFVGTISRNATSLLVSKITKLCMRGGIMRIMYSCPGNDILLAAEARQPAALAKRVTRLNARWTSVMHGIYERYKYVTHSTYPASRLIRLNRISKLTVTPRAKMPNSQYLIESPLMNDKHVQYRVRAAGCSRRRGWSRASCARGWRRRARGWTGCSDACAPTAPRPPTPRRSRTTSR